MKTIAILLGSFLFLSTVALAWGGREYPPSPPRPEDSVFPSAKRRHDYKQSLKAPFMFNEAIPFWEHHGNSFVALDFIRLAPSVPRLHGSVWRSTPNQHKEWEVEFSFIAHGQHHHGGKGLAFWYTAERNTEGEVFGNKDKWKGLGLFMDTSDPANQRLTPVIYGIVNDGTLAMPSNPTARSFPGCLRDYKNSPGPVVVRVSYIDRTLRVAADSFSRGTKMVICFEEKDIDLPVGYHFGFSAQAADTGIPDDHDLYSFEVYEVNPGPKTEKNMRPHEEEMIKKGNEVKVDDEDKLMFENIQKAVQQEERKMKEETDGPGRLTGAQFAAKVGDTQYRIIESLNAIHNKLETLGAPIQPPESSSKSLKEIDDKIQAMGISLHAMENVVSGLVEHIIKQSGVKNGPEISKVLKEELGTLKAKMEDIDYRQSYNHHLTQKTLHKSSSWVYYVVFLIVMQAAGLSAWSWYRKRLEMKEKKFI